MVEELNILLDAAVELGKPSGAQVLDNKYVITGTTKTGGRFSLRLDVVEDGNAS